MCTRLWMEWIRIGPSTLWQSYLVTWLEPLWPKCVSMVSMVSILQTGFKHVPHPYCHNVFFICHACPIAFHECVCCVFFPMFQNNSLLSKVNVYGFQILHKCKFHHFCSTILCYPPYIFHRVHPFSINFPCKFHHFPELFHASPSQTGHQNRPTKPWPNHNNHSLG